MGSNGRVTWPWKREKERSLGVLVGTLNPRALEALAAFETNVRRVEALSTGGVYARLDGQNLAIVDLADLAETDGVNQAALGEALERSRIEWCCSDAFVSAPRQWETRALSAIGAIDALPPRAIAFASFSGGVGKTTFTLDLARFVARQLHLPTLVVELTHGASAMRALLDVKLPHLYQVMTQSALIGTWDGVTVLPMEFETARMLLDRAEEIVERVKVLKARHILTIFDCEPDHELWPLLLPLVDDVFGVASPRPDAVANARRALKSVDRYRNGSRRPRTGLIVNQMRMVDRIALASLERDADVPFVDNLRFDGTLARQILPIVYPGWRSK